MAFEFETKHGIVDEETLLILSKKLTHEWRDVGKHLTLSDLDLDELESNKNYGMLRKWKQLQSKDATYSKLTDVLEKVNRQDLVTLVNEEIEKRSAGHPTKLHEAPSEPVAKKLKLMKASETESEENITNIQAKYVGEVGSTFTDAPTSFTSPIPIEESLQLFVQELKQTYQSMIRAFRPVPHLNASVNEIFVDTRLEELEENAHYWENRWSLSSYCRDAVLKKDAQRLLLIGNHGFGKSTLCLQVAYEWVTAVKSSPTSEIDILLFIRLQEVPDVKSIYRMIKLLLLPKGCKLKDETIEEILRLPQLRVVLLLDGLDKFSKTSNKCDIYSIISGNLFPKAKVVITTSPDHINSSLLGEHIKMMRMTEFDESVQYRYIIKAAAPSKSEHEECETLIRVFKENYLLGGLCNVPLFFTMFFHLLKGNPELAKQKSITVFYDCMRKFFFNRVKNVKIAQMKGSSNVTEDSYLCLRLGKIAFDDFDEMSPNLSWSKKHLVEKLGRNGYETYTTSGILVQDKVFYESIDDAQHFNEEPELRVRFFDKTMQEYYAAHYLVQRIKDNHAKDNAKVISEYLKKLNPSNLKYFYLFACGLDDTVAKALIKFLLHNYGQDPPVLLIMEIEDANKVKEFFGTIFECSVTINTTHDSKHLQRAKAFFVTTASKFKIQIPSIELHDLFGSLNVTTGNFESKDGLNLPSLCYVKRLLLKDEGRVWTEEEFNGVLEYAAGCDGLEILEFSHCMVPFDVSEEADIPKISCKKLYVQWITVNTSFVLHLRPFKWLVPNYLLSGNAVLWELWKLEKGGPPFNNFRVLDQLRYENIDRDFYIKYRDSEWQKTNISTTPLTRNCVSDATLAELAQKIEGDWTAIAARLQINELSGITDGTDGSPQKIMYKTLKTWKDLESEHASPQVLERALRSAAQDDAADELIAVLTEESASLVAASTISREGGTVQIDGTGVELEIPPDAFQDIQGDQRVQITILPNRSFDKTAKCFEDNTTVMVELLPHNLSLRPAAKLILPHCLKLKNVVNSDVKIFCSYHKTGMEPLWEDVTKSVTFKLLETSCEVHLQRLCAIKYTISGNEVEAKRLKWYALGNKCKEDAKYVTVDIGYHLDLPVENEVYRGKLQDKFLGDSQSFFVFKEEPPSYLSVSLVQVLPVWELRPISAVSMSTSRPRTVLSSKQCCSFTFKRPCSSASLPRCVFEIAGDPQQPKYRLNVNFRALQKPVANTNVVTDDALFYLSHGLEDAWKNIGRRLLVDENDLQEISKRDVSLQLKAYLMLIKWKESVGETAFVEILIRVLNDEKTGLAKKLPASLIDGDASSHERNRLILPDKYSLMDSSDVSVEGGEVRISDTDIELNILPDSFLGPFEKHKIQLKVLPDNFFQEPAKLFEAHSTTIVELLPSDLRLKRPASLFLPHCLKLKSTKYCEVQVFQSHHAKGQNPLWEDVTKTLEYTLSESNCEIKIKRFGWIKYTLRGTQVEAKKLKLYALGDDCGRDAKYVTVDVGYHLDLPGHDDIIQDKLNGKFLGNSKQFLCFKEPREDLEVKFLEAKPKWKLADYPELPEKISFPSIESSAEQSCLFKFKRPYHNSDLPKCVFEISQGKQPVPENITITFTSQNLQPFVEDRGDAAQSHLLEQVFRETVEHEQEVDLQSLEQIPTLRKPTKNEIWKISRNIGLEWKDIGRRLDLSESDFDNISFQTKRLRDLVYQMLDFWMRKEGENATIEALQQALRDSDRSDLADDLCAGLFLSQG